MYDCELISMSDERIHITRSGSGYKIRVTDPAIRAANENRDTNKTPYPKWQDPDREFVLKDKAALMKFLEGNIDKALPKGDFESSFDAAVAEANKEEGGK